MKLDFAFLAEAASIDRDRGWFSVLNGGVDTIGSEVFPVRVPYIFLVAKITFSPEERGKPYELYAGIFGPEGQPIPSDIRSILLPKTDPDYPNEPHSVVSVLTFCNVIVPAVGEYSVRMAHKEELLGTIPLTVTTRRGG
jgi:hypothetical protein